MSNFERCVIATRESPLAMWQALHIQSVLRAPAIRPRAWSSSA